MVTLTCRWEPDHPMNIIAPGSERLVTPTGIVLATVKPCQHKEPEGEWIAWSPFVGSCSWGEGKEGTKARLVRRLGVDGTAPVRTAR
jgi:hypothetical protein